MLQIELQILKINLITRQTLNTFKSSSSYNFILIIICKFKSVITYKNCNLHIQNKTKKILCQLKEFEPDRFLFFCYIYISYFKQRNKYIYIINSSSNLRSVINKYK